MSKQAKGATFTKQQFLESNRYKSIPQDVLNALLDDHRSYTSEEVKQKIDQFVMKEAK